MSKYRFQFEMIVKSYDNARQIVNLLNEQSEGEDTEYALVSYSEDCTAVRCSTNDFVFDWNTEIAYIDLLDEQFSM